MILILFRDGTTGEVTGVEDVVHNAGSLICMDYRGNAIAMFFDNSVLAYTLDPTAIHRYREPDDELQRRRWERQVIPMSEQR